MLAPVIHRRTAVTLVELLIVIAIIGLLVQLMLPAVQASRERTRKLTCQNHIKQLALAAHSHLDTHGYYPSGGWSGPIWPTRAAGMAATNPVVGCLVFSSITWKKVACDIAAGDRFGRFSSRPRPDDAVSNAHGNLLLPKSPQSQPLPIQARRKRRLVFGSWPRQCCFCRPLQNQTMPPIVATRSTAPLTNSLDEPHMWVPANYDALKNSPQNWTETSDPKDALFSERHFLLPQPGPGVQVLDGLSKTYLCGEKFLAPEFYEDVNQTESPAMMGDNQSAWSGFEWDNHRVAWNPESRWPQDVYQPRQDGPAPEYRWLLRLRQCSSEFSQHGVRRLRPRRGLRHRHAGPPATS